eukprot:gnl/MRDRNA2_/MRDRNA2_122336_c0_seq1.p1 gnl/MRDRNA2_/MRDRNA2_122336_c0~~gnl/MRDRNA2_/MRDRNA2_122336_c0_seq1.p1  ORF type:complete len:510 (-),score=91.28 gnl/MRDRNA2_/MRDRNA2_122336_c0_seq1:13-1479(-)
MDPAPVAPTDGEESVVVEWQPEAERGDEGVQTLGTAIQSALFAEHTLLALCRCRSALASLCAVLRLLATLLIPVAVVFLLLAVDAPNGEGAGPSLVRMGGSALAACIPGVLHAIAQRYLNALDTNNLVLEFNADMEDLDSTFESSFESSFGPMHALPATVEIDEGDYEDSEGTAKHLDSPHQPHLPERPDLQTQHGEVMGQELLTQFKQLAPSSASGKANRLDVNPNRLAPLKLPISKAGTHNTSSKKPAPAFPPPVLQKVAEDASPSIFGYPIGGNGPGTTSTLNAAGPIQRPASSLSERSIFSVRTGTSIKTSTSASSRSTISVFSVTRAPAVDVQANRCNLEDLKERYIEEITQKSAEKPDERLDVDDLELDVSSTSSRAVFIAISVIGVLVMLGGVVCIAVYAPELEQEQRLIQAIIESAIGWFFAVAIIEFLVVTTLAALQWRRFNAELAQRRDVRWQRVAAQQQQKAESMRAQVGLKPPTDP